MNLIEQLGGYEYLNEFYKRAVAHGFTLTEIKEELLKYRRQHNIFEIGDKVVVKDHPFWPEDYVIHTVEQEHIGKWYMSAWRHAEPEELEAGKRLEVKSEN